ncbi:MAG: hypothetical protein C5B48_04775 [Candidatus Rokuibacteriota bacterium]|nr:MAG: hypothetical protein C5B48_04775 [Candidatus Rokubacteria bacterium]
MSYLPTHYTISDERYFPGTVALLNSLRLTGNEGAFVVLDAGLAGHQRERLERHARVVEMRRDEGVSPVFLRPSVRTLQPSGVVVFLDSDVIVTASLEGVVYEATAGRICAAPDLQQRFFPEWQELFALAAPVRKARYVNAGLLAFSLDRWPELLYRWQEVSERIIALDPPDLFVLDNEAAARHPYAFNDQDALNALLMSELPEDAVCLIDAASAPTIHALRGVRCVDPIHLHCVNGTTDVQFIHYINGPKPWEPTAWITMTDDAYVRLLPRLLLADDVPIALHRSEVAPWLRGGFRSRLLVPSLSASTSVARTLGRALPRSTYEDFKARLRAR